MLSLPPQPILNANLATTVQKKLQNILTSLAQKVLSTLNLWEPRYIAAYHAKQVTTVQTKQQHHNPPIYVIKATIVRLDLQLTNQEMILDLSKTYWLKIMEASARLAITVLQELLLQFCVCQDTIVTRMVLKILPVQPFGRILIISALMDTIAQLERRLWWGKVISLVVILRLQS